jgi:diguanylate cyclase (GGDEF)-like protein/PAS domain S-box-containing protein
VALFQCIIVTLNYVEGAMMHDCPPDLMTQIITHATDSVICTDAAGKTVWVNDQFTQMSGYQLEEMLGKTPGSILQGADTDQNSVAKIRSALRDRLSVSTELLNYDKNQKPYWINLSITPILDKNGEVTRFLSIERDITLYKKLMQESEASAEREKAKSDDLHLVGQMSSWLFSAQSIEELVIIIRESMQKLLPRAEGSIFLYSNSRDCLEYSGGWGKPNIDDLHFKPDDCWGLRRGRSYAFGGQAIMVPCNHALQDETAYACLPIVAHGDTIGLLHIDFPRLSARGMAGEKAHAFERDLELAQICVEQISLATAMVRLQTELRDKSVKDLLTGLWNRRWFLDMAASELRRATKSNKPMSIIMLDVDHFKRFNDEHGHDAGDTALKVLAAHLTDIDREGVYPARFGGEEFAIICANTSTEEAVALVDGLRDKVSQAPLIHAGQRLPSLNFSAGVVNAQATSDLRTLITCADKALYAAKAAGRQQTEVFDEALTINSKPTALASKRQRVEA